MFEAKNISVNFGAKKILNGVSVEINTGEVVALLGANGAGKSTLLKTFCGDIKPSSGEICFGNCNINELEHYELARKRAVLSQHSTLNFPFTALEVALLGRNPHVIGSESKKDLEIVHEAMLAVEIEHLADRLFPTLSGGEQQRVHLARVLAQIWEKPKDSPRYLLLDEPTSSLDLAHQHLTLRIARKLSREDSGVLVVLHDLNLAAQYADQIYLLKDGKIYKHGNPFEILNAPNVKAVFDFDVTVIEHESVPLIVPQTVNIY